MLVYGECECFVMQMVYVCVHPVAVLNAAFCMTCLSLNYSTLSIVYSYVVVYQFLPALWQEYNQTSHYDG